MGDLVEVASMTLEEILLDPLHPLVLEHLRPSLLALEDHLTLEDLHLPAQTMEVRQSLLAQLSTRNSATLSMNNSVVQLMNNSAILSTGRNAILFKNNSAQLSMNKNAPQ